MYPVNLDIGVALQEVRLAGRAAHPSLRAANSFGAEVPTQQAHIAPRVDYCVRVASNSATSFLMVTMTSSSGILGLHAGFRIITIGKGRHAAPPTSPLLR